MDVAAITTTTTTATTKNNDHDPNTTMTTEWGHKWFTILAKLPLFHSLFWVFFFVLAPLTKVLRSSHE